MSMRFSIAGEKYVQPPVLDYARIYKQSSPGCVVPQIVCEASGPALFCQIN
jgi:hypothetical protein